MYVTLEQSLYILSGIFIQQRKERSFSFFISCQIPFPLQSNQYTHLYTQLLKKKKKKNHHYNYVKRKKYVLMNDCHFDFNEIFSSELRLNSSFCTQSIYYILLHAGTCIKLK